ncbi:MAG: putative branched-chain amino acid transporter ATP-binding protein [Pseudonocardiales bacterium]|nr:putative branched-chain amino acid transporter ATP-binding protein [Pseudonocardiales bacterium]
MKQSKTPGVGPLLEVKDLRAGYGARAVLHGVDLRIDPGEVVVLLGANGAGKTTTLRAITGLIPSQGELRLNGRSIQGNRPDELVRLGVSHVPQGRGTLGALTVEENLRAGAITRRDREISTDIDATYDHFPRLAARRREAAGRLSGGEQQMLAIGRALLARPRLLLLDEPSLGLAPLVIQDVMSRLATLRIERGMAMLLVEQNASSALELASRAYVLEAGRIAVSGPARELRDDATLRAAYLGY